MANDHTICNEELKNYFGALAGLAYWIERQPAD